jgi:mRNA-degrading endonuclease toxin of MazEF toxin-antitoxin module
MPLMCTFATPPSCCSRGARRRPSLALASEEVTALPGCSSYIVIVTYGPETLPFDRELKHTHVGSLLLEHAADA